jgi:hypothetical protein
MERKNIRSAQTLNCDDDPATVIDTSPVIKTYKLPDGSDLHMTANEFNELVDCFRLLARWRDDECNKSQK